MDAALHDEFVRRWGPILHRRPWAYALFSRSLLKTAQDAETGEFLYWESRDRQLLHLGYPMTDTSRHTLSEVRSFLVKVGAWTVHSRAAQGHTACYSIRLTPYGVDDAKELPEAQARASGRGASADALRDAEDREIVPSRSDRKWH